MSVCISFVSIIFKRKNLSQLAVSCTLVQCLSTLAKYLINMSGILTEHEHGPEYATISLSKFSNKP